MRYINLHFTYLLTYVPDRHGRTYRQTDDVQWHITALCVASRGKTIRMLTTSAVK